MTIRLLIGGVMSAVLVACALQQHKEKVNAAAQYDFSPVRDKILSWVDSNYYSGASIIVAKNNEIIYEQYFGNYAPATQVYIASAGKWLAAAAGKKNFSSFYASPQLPIMVREILTNETTASLFITNIPVCGHTSPPAPDTRYQHKP